MTSFEDIKRDYETASAPKKRKRVKRRRMKTLVVVGTSGVAVSIVGYQLRNPLNKNIHWAEKQRMKDLFKKAVANESAPLAVRTLTFVRWYPLRSRPFDEGDNLNASFKWFRDAACEWLGLPNDGPSCGVTFAYEDHLSDDFGVTVRFA